MNRHYGHVAERAGHRCEYCRAPEAIFNLPFEVEHIIPASEHGPDEESNLALACRACNLFKSDQQTCFDEESGTLVRLFHPRHDRWDEHFGVNLESGEVLGATAVGRATIACLRMNREIQRKARIAWCQLGLYP